MDVSLEKVSNGVYFLDTRKLENEGVKIITEKICQNCKNVIESPEHFYQVMQYRCSKDGKIKGHNGSKRSCGLWDYRGGE